MTNDYFCHQLNILGESDHKVVMEESQVEEDVQADGKGTEEDAKEKKLVQGGKGLTQEEEELSKTAETQTQDEGELVKEEHRMTRGETQVASPQTGASMQQA